MYDKSDAALGGLASDSVFRREHVPIIRYRLSNGQEDEFRQLGRCPSRTLCPPWNTLSSMRAVARHLCNGATMGRELLSRKPLPKLTQPGEFTVFLQAVGEKKIEVIGEVRFLTRLGLKEAKGLVEGVPKNLKEDVAKDEVRDTLVGSSSDRRH
jgi:hypothetical protein